MVNMVRESVVVLQMDACMVCSVSISGDQHPTIARSASGNVALPRRVLGAQAGTVTIGLGCPQTPSGSRLKGNMRKAVRVLTNRTCRDYGVVEVNGPVKLFGIKPTPVLQHESARCSRLAFTCAMSLLSLALALALCRSKRDVKVRVAEACLLYTSDAADEMD